MDVPFLAGFDDQLFGVAIAVEITSINFKQICAILVLYLLAVSLICPVSVSADENWGTFSVYFENDMFSGTDQHYTNGVKLSWISPDLTDYAKTDRLPKWSLSVIQHLPFINEPGLQRNVVLSVGQNMYTPSDIKHEALIEDDRPYAGWTYAGIGLHSKNQRRLDSMEIQAGIIGPDSFAEETQQWVHELRGLQRPNGWDNQVKNELGLAVVYERKWRFFSSDTLDTTGWDLIPHLGAALGNVYTYANAGVEARWGWNIPRDFGISLIRPAGESNAPVDSDDLRISLRRSFSLYVFIMADGRAVLRNIFLDGNTFAGSHDIDKTYFVTDLGAGAGLMLDRFKLCYTQVVRTKEFKKQKKNQVFGSITFSFTYRL